jgi:5'-nucleotidase
MPTILVTNDDGYFSEGIIALTAALEVIGDVTVVAPASEQSGAAHSVTVNRPLRVRKIDERRYCIDGTPADCVTLALSKILPELPEIVVSGINHGPNLGDDVTYSGTFAGALEASVSKLPGIAASLAARGGDFTRAAKFVADLTRQVLKEALPEGTILNVNIPPGEIRGARFTHQGIKIPRFHIHEGVDPRGRNYYWIGEREATWKRDSGSDYEAIEEGLVSITPLRTEMTDFRTLEALQSKNGGSFVRFQKQADDGHYHNIVDGDCAIY